MKEMQWSVILSRDILDNITIQGSRIPLFIVFLLISSRSLSALVFIIPHWSFLLVSSTPVFKSVFGSPLWCSAEDRCRDSCQSALWDCFGDAFSTWRQIRPPKQSHNALWQPSRPSLPRNLKVANGGDCGMISCQEQGTKKWEIVTSLQDTLNLSFCFNKYTTILIQYRKFQNSQQN